MAIQDNNIQNENVLALVPPHNIEAEQACLGAMLLNRDVIPIIADTINENDFYDERHKTIYRAIIKLQVSGKPVDLVTLTDFLEASNQTQKAGGLEYVVSLPDIVPMSVNAGYYARIVFEKSILRSIIKAADEIKQICYNFAGDIDDVIDRAEQLLFNATQRNISGDLMHIREILEETIEMIDKQKKRHGTYTGLPTGFTRLDEAMGGLQSSNLIIIAARPSMGKTAFALNIAENVAKNEGVGVLIFSLEMSRHEIGLRMLSSASRVSSQNIRKGILSTKQWGNVAKAAGELSETTIYIDDTASIGAMSIRAKARRLAAEHKNLGLIVVDYIQLMAPGSRSENRQQIISEISRSLKTLARELDVPVIALSQLSRAVESRPDKRPILSDLRESGSIEQDADVVLFLYREDYYKRKDDKQDDDIIDPNKRNVSETEVIIGKQRNGPSGITIKLAFVKEFTRFENLGFDEEF